MKILSTHGGMAIHHVGTNAGIYMLRYPGHAMAAMNREDGWYFLDPETGLWRSTSASDFEEKIWELYGDRKGEMWTCQQVANS